MKKAIIFISLLFSVHLGAQELNLEECLQSLLSQALEINIAIRIFLPSEEPTISLQNSKLTTMPGQSVIIDFEGGNIKLKAILTPYKDEDGELLLVAQGQVWITDKSPDNTVQYLSSFISLPVSFGETVLFFPLGMPEEIESSEYLNIEMAIQITPLKEAQ